ncbi:MAG: DUF503 family protein [Cryobacterium sp.]|nr:DUF503 family protein [Oligoflexia bacterium]
MLVGTGRIVLDFYNNTEGGKKRKLLEDLCTQLRKKFNVSALEVADFEDPERCVVGFAAVIPESWKLPSARSFVEKIAKEIDQTAFARVTVEDLEILEHGTSPGYEQD